MDFWREIFMALSRNKLRTFLTGFAISWGIFILIVINSARVVMVASLIIALIVLVMDLVWEHLLKFIYELLY